MFVCPCKHCLKVINYKHLINANSCYFAGVFLESTTEFTVDARAVVPRTAGKVKAFVTAPSGTRTEALVNDLGDGTFKCMYTPFEQGWQESVTVDLAFTCC